MIRFILLTCSLLSISAPALAQTEIEVIAEQATQSYSINGSIFLDRSFEGDGHTRVMAATCINCQWYLQEICANPVSTMFDLGYVCAQSNTYACVDKSQKRFRVWYLGPGQWRPSDWQVTGSVCVGPSGPPTITNLVQSISDQAKVSVPKLDFQIRPPSKALVNLPVRAEITSPASILAAEIEVSGVPVSILARATYHVRFGDGAALSSSRTVFDHTYLRPANYQVQVTAYWSASWSSPLHGQHQVPGDSIIQQASKSCSVIMAKALLQSRGKRN